MMRRVAGSEGRIDVREDRFESLAAGANLRIKAPIGNVYGQQGYALERTDGPATSRGR